jgi:hypothetical protein
MIAIMLSVVMLNVSSMLNIVRLSVEGQEILIDNGLMQGSLIEEEGALPLTS